MAHNTEVLARSFLFSCSSSVNILNQRTILRGLFFIVFTVIFSLRKAQESLEVEIYKIRDTVYWNVWG